MIYLLLCDCGLAQVFDAFGNVRSNLTRDVQKQPIDHKGPVVPPMYAGSYHGYHGSPMMCALCTGAEKGHAYTDEELTELAAGRCL